MTLKLGAHCLTGTSDAIRLAQAGMKIFKVIDNAGMADDILKIVPDATIIGLISTDYRPVEDYDKLTPKQAANKFFNNIVGGMRSAKSVKMWEGPNEPLCDTMERMDFFNAFTIEMIDLMAAEGWKYVVGGFSVGQPRLDIPVWEHYLPAIRYGMQHGAWLGLHEYSWPDMRWMYGHNQIDPNEDAGDEGWVTLRYRKVYRQFLIPNNLVIPLIMTEAGIDSGVNPKPFDGGGNFRDQGYRDGIDQWNNAVQEPNAYYARNLMWYESELAKDDYVVGATVFTIGSTARWTDFDIAGTGVIDELIKYFNGTKKFEPYPSAYKPLNNQLVNPSFEGGYYKHNGITELPVPDGWKFWYQTDTSLRLPNQQFQFYPPENVVWNYIQANRRDQIAFFRSGKRILKCFKGWGAIWFKFSQKAKTVVGHTYRFSVDVYPDLVADYDKFGNKVFATDPICGEHRVTLDDGWFDWQDGRKHRFGEWSTLSASFVATQSEHEVGFEIRGRYGLKNNGWFIDNAILEDTSINVPPVVTPPVVVPPVVTPPVVTPPPVVVSPETTLSVLDRVKVNSLIGLRVRETPSITGKILAVESYGAKGYVMRDKVVKDGVTWYKVLYDNDIYGWSSMAYLEKTS